MEIRSRYTLIGLFTLGVISAGFAFVYWLNTSAGLGQRAFYRIRYDSPVSGLLKGSAVLFNGIRVGEVSELGLAPGKPRGVNATISVAATTPVRSDTKVGLEFEGLTGAPVITLEGGCWLSTPVRCRRWLPIPAPVRACRRPLAMRCARWIRY